MRIGVIGDIHGDIAALAEVLSLLSEYKLDMLLLVGDIGPDTLPPGLYKRDLASYFPRGYRVARGALEDMWRSSVLCTEKLLTSLKVPVYLVPGNHDLSDYPIANAELVFNCDRRVVKAAGVNIVGWGGAHRTILGWPYEWLDSEAERAWQESRLSANSRPSVLLSHSPPHHHSGRLKYFLSSPVSSFVQSVVERTAPSICVCGHLHSEYGVKQLGQTLVVRAGSINKQVYSADTMVPGPGEALGCQAILLECSDDLEEIEALEILLPVRKPLVPTITKTLYRLHGSATK